MNSFHTLTSIVIPLPISNIDTDQIIPARYLKVTDKAGLAEGLFIGWRYQADGSQRPDFPLNAPLYQGASILLAGDNFGCGSSREHAPWALTGWGIRAVISSSFADIFRNNALKNGLLPVVVDPATLTLLFQRIQAHPGLQATIDLASQTLTVPAAPLGSEPGSADQFPFPIDPFSKTCLLAGVDELGYLLAHEADIRTYEVRIAPAT